MIVLVSFLALGHLMSSVIAGGLIITICYLCASTYISLYYYCIKRLLQHSYFCYFYIIQLIFVHSSKFMQFIPEDNCNFKGFVS